MHNVLTEAEATDDALASLQLFRSRLKRARLGLTKEMLQSLLFYSNMAGEAGRFWHPDLTDFKTFTEEVVPTGYIYDLRYNLLLRKESK